jgi:tetratricopeptide (TPR) repeat protein
MRAGRLWFGSLLILVVGAGAFSMMRALETRKFRAGLERAKQEMAAGLYATARNRLVALSLSGNGGGEVEYQLGLCELRRGHPDAAVQVWQRVPPASPFATRAAVQCAIASMDAGHFTRAEEILDAARRRATGTDAVGLFDTLEVLYGIEGRTEDLRRSIIESWRYSAAPAKVVRHLFRLDSAPLPLGTIRQALRRAVDDDRLWLGRANLATRTGEFEAAEKLLDACLKRRPDDPVVWRARLELAQAAGDVAWAWRALEHLPAESISDIEVPRIRAWLARKQRDGPAEREALRALLERDRENIAALDRLTTIAALAGDVGEASRLRSKRAEITAARERYRSLLIGDPFHGDPFHGDPAELARLAESLGRSLEARGWAMIRDGKAGERGSSRPALAPDGATSASGFASTAPRRTVAELCADLRSKIPQRAPEENSRGLNGLARSREDEPPGEPDSAAARTEPRPPSITKSQLVRFIDEAEETGLRFVHDNGKTPLKRAPETMSGGIALFDYDGDGWLDVYTVQGGPLPPGVHSSCADRLFRNRGDGTFEDASEKAGISQLPGGYGHGIAVGDYDNDGHPDLFITRWRSYVLLRNRGDGTFEDVAARSGLGGDRDWPTSAAWADLDGDGDLDLYVCHYLVFDLNNPRVCASAKAHGNQYCDPIDFDALPDHVFRNDGGRFVDVTKGSGFVDPGGRGLGVLAADLDDDNRIDVYVANDMSANYLFHNLGAFRFVETALSAGAAANSSGRFQSGMGVACGDLDGDGRPDLAVTNYYGESTTLFRNLGRGLFTDDTAPFGLAAPTRWLLGFGVAFLDVNNDGWLDLISANGNVNDNRPAFPWKMPTQLLLGEPGGRLRLPVATDASDPFAPLHLSRGLAAGDLDNDGRIDAVVQSQNEPIAYLHNRTDHAGHWVTLRLEGVRSNRDGVGARVEIVAGGRRHVAQRVGGGSYQSAGDPRLHFGLGHSSRLERLEVRWPSGKLDSYVDLPADRGYLLREGEANPQTLRGWQGRAR